MRSRLAMLAALLTFAGSMAGFHLTAAAGVPSTGGPDDPAQAAVDEAPVTRVVVDRGCPVGRLWEEA